MRIRFYIFLFLVSVLSITVSAQEVQSTPTASQLMDAFTAASNEYNVPVDILKGVAYAQTRFTNFIEPNIYQENTTYPVTYGIMGLRNDKRVGYSLLEGAKLINQPPEIVAVNPALNIRAAAALLSSIADSLKINRLNLNNWSQALGIYSGIKKVNIQPFFAFDVLKVLADGTSMNGISIQKHSEINLNQFSKFVYPRSTKKSSESIQSVESADYGPAVWNPSPNYNTNSIDQLFAVVHDTECNFAIALATLTDPDNGGNPVSSHYLIRSSDGYIVQLVRENDKAWHVGCWNSYMLGVEHEGFVAQPKYFTDTMYKASAGLFRHFIEQYGIPLDSNHIIGHDQHLFPWWVNYINQNYPYIDPTCNTHTDPGQYWNWNYYYGLIQKGAHTPSLASHTPASSTDSVWTNSPISVTFSIAMDTARTREAFSISPPVEGSFSWDVHKHTLSFTPKDLLAQTTQYKVTINNSAESILGAALDSTYSFEFVTKANSEPVVVSTYPDSNQTGISTTVKAIIKFNSQLIKWSLSGKILLQDTSGNTIPLGNLKYNDFNNEGILTFTPLTQLKEETKYKIVLLAGIENIHSIATTSAFTLDFTTGKDNFIKGTVIDDFEVLGDWTGPDSSFSKGINTKESYFSIQYGTEEEGSHSGKIAYVFDNTAGGNCTITDTKKLSLGSAKSLRFGLWIFGDISNNLLSLNFSNSLNEIISINTDTLNWTGWKFIEVPLSSINLSGTILFDGISIIQSEFGMDSSIIYVDGAQIRDTTAISNIENSEVPGKYYLAQNYPNPFNPTTSISYKIPSSCYVALKIYDMLGRETATLVNGRQNAGNYTINFNADKLTSGIYFYTLKAGGFSDTKKMLLIK